MKLSVYSILISLSMCMLFSCISDVSEEYDWKQFDKLNPDDTGIEFKNDLSETVYLNIIEYMYYYNGGGVAVGDINNDGLDDIYFGSNQGQDKLYLNQGDLRFVDITEQADVRSDSTWTTGISMADVDHDGWQDIYVSRVGLFEPERQHNLLYINNGDGTFSERAEELGVAFSGFSTQTTFFDYDRDGDLDMYLLNHSIHTVRSYGKTEKRMVKDSLSGDIFYENRLNESEGAFVDVTDQTGIYSSALGYGLTLTSADFNNDGWMDIYVGNDFHENDYLYINNRDRTFTESIAEYFSHTTKFTMGVDVADIDGDGLLDIYSNDMMPYDADVTLRSGGEDPDQVFQIKRDFGYEDQLARNHMQMQHPQGGFYDVALQTQTHATDWSWSVLMQDYDNDGDRDIFISNGIVRRPNDLDYINYLNSYDEENQSQDIRTRTEDLINNMPSQPLPNILFTQEGELTFSDVKSSEIGEPSFSTGAAYSDLDLDGDLDLIINNINQPAYILENKIEGGHYLSISLAGDDQYPVTNGTKVALYQGQHEAVALAQTTRGFQSSSTQQIHFGLPSGSTIDSLRIDWPDGAVQIEKGIKADQHMKIARENTTAVKEDKLAQSELAVGSLQLFAYQHQENPFFDYNREKLIPEKLSHEGPALVTADFNGDGLKDVYIGGAQYQEGRLYIAMANGGYKPLPNESFRRDAVHEDVDATEIDIDGDGDLDLYVVSGGSHLEEMDPGLQDRIYINNGGGDLRRVSFSLPHTNGSTVSAGDYDGDGYEDLFIGSRSIPGAYGLSPYSFILRNNQGAGFSLVRKERMGMITDSQWGDIDGDGQTDLVICGDWMSPRVLMNEGDTLIDRTADLGLSTSQGLWNAIALADLNNDGRLDIIAANAGLNLKWQATDSTPVTMDVIDIDDNGTIDPIIFYDFFGRRVPFASYDQLASQWPGLRKQYKSYADFSEVDEITDFDAFDPSRVAEHRELTELRSLVFLSSSDGYDSVPLNKELQLSTVQDLLIIDDQLYYVSGHREYLSELGPSLANSGGVLSDLDAQKGTFGRHDYISLPRHLSPRDISVLSQNSLFISVNNGNQFILTLK